MDSDEWRRVVKRYSNLLASRLGEFMQYGDQAEAIPQDLKSLQDKLQANIVAADEFENDTKDEKLANMFRRRDLACERVVLGNLIRKNATKLAKAVSSSEPANKNISQATLRNKKMMRAFWKLLACPANELTESNQKGKKLRRYKSSCISFVKKINLKLHLWN